MSGKSKRKRQVCVPLRLELRVANGNASVFDDKHRELACRPLPVGISCSKDSIVEIFARKIFLCDSVLAFLGNRQGAGGQVQRPEKFVTFVIDRLRPILQQCVASCGKDDLSLVLFVAVRDFELNLSVVFEENSVGIMSALCSKRPDEIFVPLEVSGMGVNASYSTNSLDHKTSRAKGRCALKLKQTMDSLLAECKSLSSHVHKYQCY